MLTRKSIVLALALACVAISWNACAEDAKRMSERALIEKMTGEWEGTAKTWFFGDKPADESKVSGKIAAIPGTGLIRHTYDGSMKGKPRHGEEVLAYNKLGKAFEVSWFDSFHMPYGILFSLGKASDKGFTVRGDYDVGDGKPKWGWKTVYELIDDDHLTVTAYNIKPDGKESKAVETVYARKGK